VNKDARDATGQLSGRTSNACASARTFGWIPASSSHKNSPLLSRTLDTAIAPGYERRRPSCSGRASRGERTWQQRWQKSPGSDTARAQVCRLCAAETPSPPHHRAPWCFRASAAQTIMPCAHWHRMRRLLRRSRCAYALVLEPQGSRHLVRALPTALPRRSPCAVNRTPGEEPVVLDTGEPLDIGVALIGRHTGRRAGMVIDAMREAGRQGFGIALDGPPRPVPARAFRRTIRAPCR